MARQLIIVSIVVLGFFALGTPAAMADDIGVGKPSGNNTTTTTSTATTDDDIGVGEGSWFELFIQSFESSEPTDS